MPRLSYFCMAAGFLFLTVMYDFYNPFLALFALLLAPLPTVCLAWRARRHIALEWTVPGTLRRGEEISSEISLHSPGLAFLPSPKVHTDLAAVGPGAREHTYTLSLSAPHCGLLDLGTVTVTVSDAFHLTSWKARKQGHTAIVLPRPMGTLSAAYALLTRLRRPDEVEHFGAAEYHPGDDVHLINWKVTARKDALYVRDTLPAGASSLLLAADLPRDGDKRDTVCDALYTCGAALLAEKASFSFLRMEGHAPRLSDVHTPDEWKALLTHFLSTGNETNPLTSSESLIPPDLPVLYLTGNPAPALPERIHPTVWSADPASRAPLSGRAAIRQALGGEEP